MKTNNALTRRTLLQGCLTAVACSLMPSFASALVSQPEARSLAFYNTHTGETLNTVYWEKGIYIPENLNCINHILRDHRTGDIREMDPRLLDLIHAVHTRLESGRPFEIISGYRSPKSNMQLYEHSSGVAFKSMHMEGKAIDLRLADRSLKTVRAAAMLMQQGGVGYYPASNFVHIDTGAVRYW